MRFAIAMLASALAIAGPVDAEVVNAGDAAFTSCHSLSIAAAPEDVWETLVHPARWWEDAHTYSGQSDNLSLDLRPGGCWCENMEGGGVEHMRVVQFSAGHMLRLGGGLGPLQAMPVIGVMTVTLEPSPTGTTLVATYAVAGPGLGGLADPVDDVLGAQWSRLKDAAES